MPCEQPSMGFYLGLLGLKQYHGQYAKHSPCAPVERSEWGIPRTGYLIPVRDIPLALARLGELLGRRRRRRRLAPIVPICEFPRHNNQKMKSVLSGGNKIKKVNSLGEKIPCGRSPGRQSLYTMDTLMVLFNVYTLGYPDGFIQCIYFQKQVLKMDSREAATPEPRKKLIYI